MKRCFQCRRRDRSDVIRDRDNAVASQTVRLTSYNIDAVTDGIDAQARVLVTVENVDTDTIFNASGLDFDVLKASAIAYINANTLVQKENAGEMARKVSYRDLP